MTTWMDQINVMPAGNIVTCLTQTDFPFTHSTDLPSQCMIWPANLRSFAGPHDMLLDIKALHLCEKRLSALETATCRSVFDHAQIDETILASSLVSDGHAVADAVRVSHKRRSQSFTFRFIVASQAWVLAAFHSRKPSDFPMQPVGISWATVFHRSWQQSQEILWRGRERRQRAQAEPYK
jgi:hypothetical protein